MAWLAIANDSGGIASRYHSVKAIWWLAIATSPSAAATNVIVSSAMRRRTVRANSGTFAAAAATMPGRSGRSGARCRRAPRTTTAHNQTAAPVWAITVPSADPATPSPSG